MTIVLAAMGLVVGIGAGMMGRPVSLSPSAPPTIEEKPAQIDVHVSGWVVSPGVVSVPQGAIVADAIDAAGGLRAGASAESVNLAASVLGGEQIVIPGPGDSRGSDSRAMPSDGLMSLNRADAAELETLPGVGPVLAERIVAYREDHGPFEAVEDLLDVPGIGESKLAAIRDLIRP